MNFNAEHQKQRTNFYKLRNIRKSRDSSVGIATGYGLGDRMIGVRFPAVFGKFSLRYRVQTGSGAHSASCPVGNGAPFLGVKATGT
jgi:hypothetical protein